MYSPQVTFYDRNGWTGDNFCNPGKIPSLGDIGWELLDSPEGENRAVDLAEFTGQKYWDDHQVRDYGMKCIASSLLAECIYRGTRTWVCSDRQEGSMSEVHEIMCTEIDKVPTILPVYIVQDIGEDYERDANRCNNRICYDDISVRDNTGESFRNTNSGNTAVIMSGILTASSSNVELGDEVECQNCETYQEYDGEGHECWECGSEDYRSTESRPGNFEDVPPQVRATYNNAHFINQVRRYEWSNG